MLWSHTRARNLVEKKSPNDKCNSFTGNISLLFLFFSGLDPECPSYYGNRSACHMMLSQYQQALEDARTSVSLDSAFVKGYIRIAKCCLTLGDAVSAGQALDKASHIEPKNAAVMQVRVRETKTSLLAYVQTCYVS